MIVKVTAIAPDGQRSSIEVEAKSVNYAAIEYNYRAVCAHQGLIVPNRETVFEVEVAGKVHLTNWATVLKWAAKEAEDAISRGREKVRIKIG